MPTIITKDMVREAGGFRRAMETPFIARRSVVPWFCLEIWGPLREDGQPSWWFIGTASLNAELLARDIRNGRASVVRRGRSYAISVRDLGAANQIQLPGQACWIFGGELPEGCLGLARWVWPVGYVWMIAGTASLEALKAARELWGRGLR